MVDVVDGGGGDALEGVDDAFFHVVGGHAAVIEDDGNDRDVDFRENVGGHPGDDHEDAEDRHQEGGDDERIGAAEGEPDDPHMLASRCGAEIKALDEGTPLQRPAPRRGCLGAARGEKPGVEAPGGTWTASNNNRRAPMARRMASRSGTLRHRSWDSICTWVAAWAASRMARPLLRFLQWSMRT